MSRSRAGLRAGKLDFLAGVHLCHATAHFLLPGWAFLFKPVKEGGGFLAFFFGKPGELLFELKEFNGAHLGRYDGLGETQERGPEGDSCKRGLLKIAMAFSGIEWTRWA
jgi:hypothetical protein